MCECVLLCCVADQLTSGPTLPWALDIGVAQGRVLHSVGVASTIGHVCGVYHQNVPSRAGCHCMCMCVSVCGFVSVDVVAVVV